MGVEDKPDEAASEHATSTQPAPIVVAARAKISKRCSDRTFFGLA